MYKQCQPLAQLGFWWLNMTLCHWGELIIQYIKRLAHQYLFRISNNMTSASPLSWVYFVVFMPTPLLVFFIF